MFSSLNASSSSHPDAMSFTSPTSDFSSFPPHSATSFLVRCLNVNWTGVGLAPGIGIGTIALNVGSAHSLIFAIVVLSVGEKRGAGATYAPWLRSARITNRLSQKRQRDFHRHDLIDGQARRLVERDIRVVEDHGARRQGDLHRTRQAVIVRRRGEDVARLGRVVRDAEGKSRRALE